MKAELFREIERLTVNAARRREDLQVTGLQKTKRKKQLTILAGIFALASAATMTTVIFKVFGNFGVQLAAALAAAISGVVSLIIATYYSDDNVFTMLLGSTKYLMLRENVYRLVIHPKMPDDERFLRLSEFQNEYIRLDETYSRYFSINNVTTPPHSNSSRADTVTKKSIDAAASQERENLRREIKESVP